MNASNLPAGAASVYVAPCGCEYSGGNWGVCAKHAKSHAEHDPEHPAPWCDQCSIPFVDEDEPEDVCRGCGAPWVSHMRTERDHYCGECRNPEDR